MRVLFVDDEADFLEVILKRMKKRDIEALGVQDGDQAIEMIERDLFDVVVLDVRLGSGRSGIEVLKDIKCRKPLVEVIMLTGHALLEAAKEGIANGAFDYMVKPADIDELFYKICDAFKKKSIQEAKISCIDKLMKIPNTS